MQLLFIAIALAMDAVAVSMANGARWLNIEFKQILFFSFIFGFFQAFMPFLGYFVGLSFANFIASIDHFVAFFILCYIGIKMIKDCKNQTLKLAQKC